MSVFNWSKTGSANGTIDVASGISFPEGMPAGRVNDGVRALMAALACFVGDQAGATVSGTANALVLLLSQSPASDAPGLFSFIPIVTNTAAVTLALTHADGSTTDNAKPLRAQSAVELASGALVVGKLYLTTFLPGTSEYLLLNDGYTTAQIVAGLASISSALSTGLAAKLSLTGGTMTGVLNLTGHAL